MGSKEKLVERFRKRPKDFTYEETLSLLAYFGYHEHTKGSTSGSRVRFKNESTGAFIDIHRPHPGKHHEGVDGEDDLSAFEESWFNLIGRGDYGLSGV